MRIYNCSRKPWRSFRGFTLIELMITVAIIGLLVSLAYSSYTSYLLKSRRAAAQTQLMAVAQREAQYLLDARTYAADLATLRYTLPTDVSSYYDFSISVVAGPPPTFTITAVPKASQATDVTLTLNSSGAKTPAGTW